MSNRIQAAADVSRRKMRGGANAPTNVSGYFGVALAGLCCLLSGPGARAQSLNPESLSRITFDQKLDAPVSLGLRFHDEEGRGVTLGEYFGKKPVILVLGYYECPMLCSLTLNGMVETLEDIRWTIGNQFEVVNVSINPRETPPLAAAKKKTYLRRYGRTGADQGWHFLTGDQSAIAALTDEVGFHYAYDPAVKQYAHPSGLVILTPQGRVAKYLFGVKFAPKELYAALDSAAGSRIGSRMQQLVLLCFHYSPIQGKYGPAIMVGVRILAAVTLVGLGWMFVSLFRRETQQSRAGVSPAPDGSPITEGQARRLPFSEPPATPVRPA